MSRPNVEIVNIDKMKISDEVGHRVANITFEFDEDITEYIVKNLGVDHTTGTTVYFDAVMSISELESLLISELESLTIDELTKFPAFTQLNAEVDYTELSSEGVNRINIYGKSANDGEWTEFNDNNPVRYIRDWLGYGSTSNGSSHWIEIKAFDLNDNNVALNKIAYRDGDKLLTCPALVDGDIDTGQWTLENMDGGSYRVVDLGQKYELDRIQVWHYYGDGRTYYNTKTEVSPDGVNWYTIFDSDVDGEYSESSAGKTHYV